MQISADMVKELRKRTGAGMMECKKALIECSSDIDAAIELLRKTGQAKADKKSSRIASEGCVVCKLDADKNQAVLLEINSETDFAANDESFKMFSEQAAATALHHEVDSIAALTTTTSVDSPKYSASATNRISEHSSKSTALWCQLVFTNSSTLCVLKTGYLVFFFWYVVARKSEKGPQVFKCIVRSFTHAGIREN